jgi:hypothetical protein
MATDLRGVKPEENRSPNYRLTATGKPPKTVFPSRRKINPPFLVALHADSTPGRFPKLFYGTNS